MESGKRKYSRSEFCQIITYSLFPCSNEKNTTALLHNFSYSGLCIITKNILQEGQEILINSGLIGNPVTAVVRWCIDMGDSNYKVGLKIK